MPFAGYEDWDECIAKNKDKGNPEAYCGKIKHQVEDKKDTIPPECIVKTINHYKTKYPEWSMNDVLKKSFNYLKNRDVKDFIEDTISVRETKNYTRKRQFDPSDCEEGTYRTFIIGKGKKAIGCKRKSTGKFAVQTILEPKGVTKDTYDYLYNFNPAEVRLILQALESFYLNEEEDPYFAETIRNIADQINASSTGLFEENEESAIYLLNLIKEKYGESKTKTGHGWWGESERHSKARKFGKADTLDFILLEIAQEYEQQVHDFLTYDVEGQPATHLQEQFEQLKELEESARTPQARALRESLGGTFKPPVESIDVPFSIINSETGAVVRGYVKSNFEKNTTQLRPVSSSNVRGVGRFKDELLVQFHGNDRVARRTYRYKMGSPEMAEEAFNSLVDSSSPGRWVWENIRGHRKGEPTGIQNVPEKYGKALQPWSKTGKKVIGGTTASLVEYNISNRVPVSRVSNFEAMSSQMKRKTSNVSKNPNTGSRLEGTLEGRRQSRDRGVKQLGAPRQVRQLPKLDFAIHEIDANDLVLDSWEELLKWVKEKKKPKDNEEAEKIAWAIINSSQTKATEKAKKPYKEGKFYDISALKKKLPEGERWRLQFIEDAIKLFPKKAFKKANPEILIVSKITDHEDYKQYKGKVPKYYQQMGIDRTYEEVRGIYSPIYNQCVISLKNNRNGFDTMKTIYHEVAHAVWEYGGTPLHLKQRLVQAIQLYKKDIGEKYYHEPTEMFAVLFEIEGHALLFKEKAKIKKREIINEFIQLYDRFRKVMI